MSTSIESRIPDSLSGSLSLLLRLVSYLTQDEQEEVVKGIFLAATAHTGQVRKNGHPFIIHPIQVTCIVADVHSDLPTILAALLHDTLEVTDLKPESIRQACGPEVLGLVESVTHHKAFSNREFLEKVYNRSRDDQRVAIIKLADRSANLMHDDQRVFPLVKERETLDETHSFYLGLLATLPDLPHEITRTMERITQAAEQGYRARGGKV